MKLYLQSGASVSRPYSEAYGFRATRRSLAAYPFESRKEATFGPRVTLSAATHLVVGPAAVVAAFAVPHAVASEQPTFLLHHVRSRRAAAGALGQPAQPLTVRTAHDQLALETGHVLPVVPQVVLPRMPMPPARPST